MLPILALAILGATYYLGLYQVPRIGWVHDLMVRHRWLGPGVSTQCFFLLVSLAVFSGFRDPARFGLRRCRIRSMFQAMGLAALVSGITTVVLFLFVAGDPGPGPAKELTDEEAMKNLLRTIFNVWIVASFCEEAFYRGMFQGLLRGWERFGFRLSGLRVSLPVFLSGLLFGLGHLCLLGNPRMPTEIVLVIVGDCMLVGWICAYFRERTGSLWPAWSAHVIANVVGMVLGGVLGK